MINYSNLIINRILKIYINNNIVYNISLQSCYVHVNYYDYIIISKLITNINVYRHCL